MQFNRQSAADEAAKSYAAGKAKQAAGKVAKKAAKKVGQKVGKKAAKVAAKTTKIIASIVGAMAPLLPIFACAFVLIILPAVIFSSALGLDSATPDGTVETNMGTTWEDDAAAAINARHAQLVSENFWSDLGSFFSTGSWGTRGETFKTEYAKADDIDPDTGESVSAGYFSASNRLIALIDEAFRSSLRDNDGPALKTARNMATSKEAEFRAEAEATYPKPADVDAADYNISFAVEKDPTLEDQHFIAQSCYVLAAASSTIAVDDEFSSGVRKTLDYAFALTGLDYDPTVTEICWEGTVSPTYNMTESSYTIPAVTESFYIKRDASGAEVDRKTVSEVYWESLTDPFYYDQLSADGYALEAVETTPAITKRKIDVSIVVTYSVILKSNYKQIINEMCDISDVKGAGEEASQEDAVEASSMELMKMYGSGGGFADPGSLGNVLPTGTYHISSRFGWRTLNGEANFHGGVDLATGGVCGVPIYAAQDGVVTVPGFMAGGYGYWCYITHTRDDGSTFVTIYGHMNEAPCVSDGDTVVMGQQIGSVGSTGLSTGPHLHFEIRDPDYSSGNKIDPETTSMWEIIEGGQ